MKLSKRLHTIYDMVKPGYIAADIGCDHGLLPIALVKGKKCEKVYACDVRKGPLSRAKEAIVQAGLCEHIETRLCDGLQEVPEDVQTIIIAGMGYDTIVHILEDAQERLPKFTQLLIQCNSHVDELRAWCSNHNLMIEAEELIKDHHYYQLLSLRYGKQTLSQEECLFGLYLDTHPLFHEYWSYRLMRLRRIHASMLPSHEGYADMQQLIQRIETKLKERS